MGGNFREKLEEAPRIKFRGFKFRGAMVIFSIADDVMNFELIIGVTESNWRCGTERRDYPSADSF